jgi:hypothetical protein
MKTIALLERTGCSDQRLPLILANPEQSAHGPKPVIRPKPNAGAVQMSALFCARDVLTGRFLATSVSRTPAKP